MRVSDWLSVLAIMLSPVIAIFITRWADSIKSKKDRKHALFLSLVSERHLRHLSFPFVQALNQIPVIFYKNEDVVQYYERYIDLLSRIPVDVVQVDAAFLNLLHCIAQHLGYSDLKQTEMGNHYFPSVLHERIQGEMLFYGDYYRNRGSDNIYEKP